MMFPPCKIAAMVALDSPQSLSQCLSSTAMFY